MILEKILSPISINDFIKDFWENKVLYLKNNKSFFYERILSISDINEYLSRNDIKYPNLRMVKNGSEVPLNEYAYEYLFAGDIFQGNIDMDKVFYLYENGSTINLQLVENLIDKSSRFTNKLENQCRFPIQLHLFITPPFSQGFTEHYDTNSFFIFQLDGEKTWEIYNAPYPLPLLKHRDDVGDKYIDEIKLSQTITLKKGELLYIPSGTYHKAITNKKSSVHMTIGLFPNTWSERLHKLVDELSLHNVDFRKSSISYLLNDNNDLNNSFYNRLKTMQDSISSLSGPYTENYSKQIPDLKNRFINALHLNDVHEETLLKIRNVNFNIQKSNQTISILFYDKSISLPISFEDEIEFIMSQKFFRPLDINTSLDINNRIILCKTLISEGFLSIEI